MDMEFFKHDESEIAAAMIGEVTSGNVKEQIKTQQSVSGMSHGMDYDDYYAMYYYQETHRDEQSRNLHA